jgi:hypothetical protein
MLRHTLILPETDVRYAARLFRDAIDALDTVLMLAFGKDDRSKQIVAWADRLADKTGAVATLVGTTMVFNPRHVVWIRDPDPASLREVLTPILGPELPRVAVLNFHDVLKGRLEEQDTIDPVALELLFAKGHQP